MQNQEMYNHASLLTESASNLRSSLDSSRWKRIRTIGEVAVAWVHIRKLKADSIALRMNLPPRNSPANCKASAKERSPLTSTWPDRKVRRNVICKSDILSVETVLLRGWKMNFWKMLIGCSHRFSWPRVDDQGLSLSDLR